MSKVHSDDKYDFYIIQTTSKYGEPCEVYNIVKKGSHPPTSGFLRMKYIENRIGAKFPDKYQPKEDTNMDDKTIQAALDFVNEVSEFQAYLDLLNQGDPRVKFLLSKELMRLIHAGQNAEHILKKISGEKM